MVSAPARRDVVRFMVPRGLSERRALRVIRTSASALRYQSAPDRNGALRERISSEDDHPYTVHFSMLDEFSDYIFYH